MRMRQHRKVRIPARAGIGLRAPHYQTLLARKPAIAWLEVHSENYFGDGGQPLDYLERARELYPLSLHGVGLSLGSSDRLERRHLRRLRALIERFQPGLVSEHLCWSSVGGRHLNDLLPLPRTEEALRNVSANVAEAQDVLGRQILVENVSSYLEFRHDTMPESEFVARVASATGCGILLDVNNVYVSAVNHGFDPYAYLDSIPAAAVMELHLAGFERDGALLIDTHGARVADDVWALYQHAIGRLGPVPTLIEWDTDLPALEVLLEEARTADALMNTMMEPEHALAA